MEIPNQCYFWVRCRRVLALAAAVTVLVLMTGVSYLQAQGDSSQRERLLAEPFRLMMDEDAPVEKRALLDWGGWFRSSYWGLDEKVDRDFDGRNDVFRGLREQEFRLWGFFSIDQVHNFYGRMKLDYLDWNHSSSYNNRDNDWQGPNLERGWYDFRLSRYRAAYGIAQTDYDLGVRVGRQYVEFGTGLALSVPLDAILVTGYYRNWQLTGLGALSIPSSYNVDHSFPDNSKESRCYWGVELRYRGWIDHQPFVYYFEQADKDAGSVRTYAGNDQSFGYDSRYVGMGSTGRFFHKDMLYICEIVGEFGKSYAWPGVDERQNIHAWAFDAELRYLLRDTRLTQFELEYLLASGDSDRTFSPTNTIGGNKPHSVDHGFVGWGFRDTGLTMAPKLSNLGMIRMGASTFPMNHLKRFQNLKVGTNLYLFHKQQSEGAVSDNLSSYRSDSYLGSEMDLYADWRLTSDLSWMIRYGLFLPGDAFSQESPRHLVYTGVTLSF